MSEDRIELMDLFRRDMTGIEPTRAWPEDQNPHPAFKNHPEVFKFEQSTYLFKVWRAGRDALAAQRDEGLAREAQKNLVIDGLSLENQELQQRLAEAEKLAAQKQLMLRDASEHRKRVRADYEKAIKLLKDVRDTGGELSKAWFKKLSEFLDSSGCSDGEKS